MLTIRTVFKVNSRQKSSNHPELLSEMASIFLYLPVCYMWTFFIQYPSSQNEVCTRMYK